MVFVDTGAWFALVVESDPDHERADAWFNSYPDELLTTDFIIDELLTLLRARGHHQAAIDYGAELIGGRLANLHRISEDDFSDAWRIFVKFSDKDWSFTDCTSRCVIEKFGIRTAFCFDHHFRQFGNVQVVP